MTCFRKVMISKERLLTKQNAKTSDNFAQQLLESMDSNGLSGQDLIDTFNQAKNNVGWTAFKRDTDK
ncbi:hypothetical protein SAMN05518871_11238 [Psychrobacillus sp. OK028]|uniref:hypothetical protein n=1 Tax=Psychrobacillus sp. OK028 TaxID=1884359 RepID=UPI0008893756|nr:hypothetical protein [Psychrobacillus sp. OK028]SDO20935.1 hypothetical protein SAMN05518871_11238 [Psychrobacillus sp. OK028]